MLQAYSLQCLVLYFSTGHTCLVHRLFSGHQDMWLRLGKSKRRTDPRGALSSNTHHPLTGSGYFDLSLSLSLSLWCCCLFLCGQPADVVKSAGGNEPLQVFISLSLTFNTTFDVSLFLQCELHRSIYIQIVPSLTIFHQWFPTCSLLKIPSVVHLFFFSASPTTLVGTLFDEPRRHQVCGSHDLFCFWITVTTLWMLVSFMIDAGSVRSSLLSVNSTFSDRVVALRSKKKRGGACGLSLSLSLCL